MHGPRPLDPAPPHLPPSPTPRRSTAYFYDEHIGNYTYGGGNPMRPHRVRLTHSLVTHYDLLPRLLIHRPRKRVFEELTKFHADEYVDFLRMVTPENQDEYLTQLRRYNLGLPGEADCPVFDGMYEYCQTYCGGSVDAAALLNRGEVQTAFNWSGGMHHAKKAEASGFCYMNDIVLAILELLKTHQRVLYVDIDIHHGDGVEEAFYLTDRVMTVSFHKYGDFFPGTGALGDIGHGRGKYYALNGPLLEGIDDESYAYMFKPIMQKVRWDPAPRFVSPGPPGRGCVTLGVSTETAEASVKRCPPPPLRVQVMESFQPGAIVVCGGADSLSGDRLGCFNLSMEGHAANLEYLQSFGVPMLLLGGGGYTMRNVARCWAFETGKMLGVEMEDELPSQALADMNYYQDTGRLRIQTSNMKNANTREYLDKLVQQCLQNLSKLPAAPSVGFQSVPPAMGGVDPGAEEGDPDQRGGGQAANELRIAQDDERDGGDAGARHEYNPHEDPAYEGVARPADLAAPPNEPDTPMAEEAPDAAAAASTAAAAAPAVGAAAPDDAPSAAGTAPTAQEEAAKVDGAPAGEVAPSTAGAEGAAGEAMDVDGGQGA